MKSLIFGVFALSMCKTVSAAVKIPARLDYRLWNDIEVVSPVQDQGKIGSCWTFSTVGSVEAQMAMVGQGVVRLSQQQLVDCVNPKKKPGEEVYGFSPFIAMQYLRVMGAMPAFLYPYTSNTTMVVGKCNYKKEDVVQIVDGVCTQQMPVTEAKLKEILVRNGPQVVSLNSRSFVESPQKILSCPTPRPDQTGDHAVLLVGYDKIEGVDVWIFKNSWGNWWGNDGFGYLTRKAGTDCGILQYGIDSPILPNSPLKDPLCQTPIPRFGCDRWNYDELSEPHMSDSTASEIGNC